MKNMIAISIILLATSMTHAANFGFEAAKAGIDVSAIGSALSKKAVEEINVANKPWYCKTKSQGFGPYEGFGRTQGEAATAALKTCSIYCGSDQRLECSNRDGNQDRHQEDGTKTQALVGAIQQKDLAIQELKKSLEESKQTSMSCAGIEKNRDEWITYSKTLEAKSQALEARLEKYEISASFTKLAESCKLAFPDDGFDQNLCVGSKANPDSVAACAEINDRYYKMSCISKKAPANKIKACINMTEDNFYRMSCIDK